MPESQLVDLKLVRPNEQYRESFLAALREFRDEGLPWYSGPDYVDVEYDFASFVARKLEEATTTTAHVPKTQLWAIADERFVGRIAIHHTLTDALAIEGGHIGYDTVPSARGRGIATAMLRDALPIARSLGLSEVLVTCDDTNVASIRVIEANGGVLRAKRPIDPAKPLKRYYLIALP